MRSSVKSALRYVHENFLSKPYSDCTSNRGSYIDQNGRYQNYPKDETPPENPAAIFRLNHGTAHTIRVTSKVPDVLPNIPDDDVIDKLQIACAFYVAGHNSEISFSANPETYKQYRKKSSELFYDYAKELKKDNDELLFSEAELQIYAEALNDPYTKKGEPKSDFIKNILFSCHTLDLARCHNKEEMTKEKHNLDNPLFIKSEIQQILTGDSRKSSIDEKGEFSDTPTRKRMQLFRLANTDPDICFRLINLSEKIKTTDKANSIAILLNYYAIKSAAEFETCLTRVENTDEIDSILLEVKDISRDISAGRIIKTIRNDHLCFWPDFKKSLCDPAGHRPELRKTERGEFTNRLNKGVYEIISTDKSQRPSLHGDQKLQYTKHQPTSYVNYEVGYDSPYFGYHSERADLIVGVSFDIKDCIFQRIMLYDSGTVVRTYDKETKEAAEKYLDEKLKEGRYQTSISDLQETGLAKNSDEINEVMAGFKWNMDGSSHITIFTDNLESRLLALARAISLQCQLRKQFSDDTIIVPISIYPNFSIYTDKERQADLIEARNNTQLKHYVKIIDYLDATIEGKSNPERAKLLDVNAPKTISLIDFLKMYMLICKIQPFNASLYFSRNISKVYDDRCYTDSSDLEEIKDAVKTAIKNGGSAKFIQDIFRKIFAYTSYSTDFSAEIVSFSIEIADAPLKAIFAAISEARILLFRVMIKVAAVLQKHIKSLVPCNMENIRCFVELCRQYAPSVTKNILADLYVTATISKKTEVCEYLISQISPGNILEAFAKDECHFEHTKKFFETHSAKFNQKNVAVALKTAVKSNSTETIKFFCNVTTEKMPTLSVINATVKNFPGMRDSLTQVKQTLIQSILDYIHSLGEISKNDAKFELGFFSKRIRNPELSEKKVAHARELIKNIGNCENFQDIKYHLVRAELHNTIEFELLRTSGKSRYATCLEKLTEVVSDKMNQPPGLSM